MLRRVPPKNVDVPRACAWGSTGCDVSLHKSAETMDITVIVVGSLELIYRRLFLFPGQALTIHLRHVFRLFPL